MHPQNKGNTPIATLFTRSFAWVEPRFSRPVDKQLGEEGTEPRFELTEAHAASNAQADTSPAGGYIAWVDGRVSAAY